MKPPAKWTVVGMLISGITCTIAGPIIAIIFMQIGMSGAYFSLMFRGLSPQFVDYLNDWILGIEGGTVMAIIGVALILASVISYFVKRRTPALVPNP
jgi:hypothetical protein